MASADFRCSPSGPEALARVAQVGKATKANPKVKEGDKDDTRMANLAMESDMNMPLT